MKQSLKYGLLLVLVLLLHAMMSEAVETITASPYLKAKECSISQARPIKKAIEKFHHYNLIISCDIEYSDFSQIPTDKSFLKLSLKQLIHQGIIPPPENYLLQLYKHDPQNPIVHYIYGQRKIVI